MSNEIVVKKNGEMSLSEITELGGIFAASGMFKDVQSKAQAIVKIIAGHELGISPIIAMSQLYVVNGKVSLPSEIMADLIKKSGKYQYKIVEHTVKKCAIQFFENENGKWEKIGLSEFTIEDAKMAGLTSKDIWMKYKKNMLFGRALSNGARWYCPDAIHGAYITEELQIENTTQNIDDKIKNASDADTGVIESAAIVNPVISEMTLEEVVSEKRKVKTASKEKIEEMVRLAKKLPGTEDDRKSIMEVFMSEASIDPTASPETLTTEQVNSLIHMIKNNIPPDQEKKQEAKKEKLPDGYKKGFCVDCWNKGLKKELTPSQIKLSEKNFDGMHLCYSCQKERLI